MADVSYENLDVLIGKLKRSAIDAYMREKGYTVHENFYNSPTEPGTPGGMDPGSYTSHARPGKDGLGGDEKFQEEYAAIRSRIDKILKPWRDLPNPKDIDAEADKCRKVMAKLSPLGSVNGNKIIPGGFIGSYLSLIDSHLQCMSGDVIAVVKTKFIGAMRPAIGNLGAVSIILGGALMSERELFEGARQLVADAVDGARKACDKVVAKKSSSINLVIRLFSFVVNGIAAFAGPTAKATVQAVVAGSTAIFNGIIGDISKVDSEKPYQDLESALSAFEGVLGDINSEIRRSERAISDHLVGILNAMVANKNVFDLTIDPFVSRDGIVVLNKDLVKDITKTFMPLVAEELTDAAGKTLDFSMTSVIIRDDSIGMGDIGPGARFASLRTLLYELLREIAWDVNEGASSLNAAVDYVLNEDASTKAKFEEMAKKIEKGSQINPWNQHKPW